MHNAGGFPVDLILFGMIAAFLVLRLRSILGKRTGFEGSPVAGPRPAGAARGGPVELHTEAAPPPPLRPLPDPAGAVGQALQAIAKVDAHFEPTLFLGGAEAAFRLIVTAFAAGDRDRLRPLLSGETFDAFEAAIAAREAAGETQRTEIRDIVEAHIQQATLIGVLASITVHIVSHQVNVTLAKDGTTASGMDAITEIADLWTFKRDLTSGEATWRLSAAQTA